MKRRKFLRNISLAAASPIILNGIPVTSMANALTRALKNSEGDRVLVLVQLAGGNDGLNTMIPIDQYDKYMEYRSNIAIPDTGNRKFINLDESLGQTEQVGLHPDLLAAKSMYDEGKALFIQNVGYDNMNLSHFRGRDIWFMGGGSEDYYNSGWMGRYLESKYPGFPEEYPNDEMPDPLGLEFGFTQSLLYHRSEGIPAGIAITDPDTFHQLVTGTGIDPPSYIPESYAGDELKYLMEMELKSNQYADRLKEVYENGSNSGSVTYPTTYPHPAPNQFKDNELAWQLKIVARLLSGGIKTRIFLVKIDGFDTHAEQVTGDDPTTGTHAALLYHVSEALKAFHDDLKALGINDRVISVTTSEFGRRVSSNASLGTDHGKAAPVLLLGEGLNAGLMGSVPDLNNLDNGNLVHQFDYRQIYTSLIMDWLGADHETVVSTKFEDFIDTRLDIIKSPFGINDNSVANPGFRIVRIYPNPASGYVNLQISSEKRRQIRLIITNSAGIKTRDHLLNTVGAGSETFQISLSGLKPGFYSLTCISEGRKLTEKLLVR